MNPPAVPAGRSLLRVLRLVPGRPDVTSPPEEKDESEMPRELSSTMGLRGAGMRWRPGGPGAYSKVPTLGKPTKALSVPTRVVSRPPENLPHY